MRLICVRQIVKESKKFINLLLTWEVVKCSWDIFSRIAIGCVADHQAGFANRSVSEQDALQQPLLRQPWPGGYGIVWGHRRSHGPSVIHGNWRWHSIAQHFTAVSSTAEWRRHHENRMPSLLQIACERERHSCVKPLPSYAVPNPLWQSLSKTEGCDPGGYNARACLKRYYSLSSDWFD